MSEIAAISQGMQSVKGTGMYTARLNAFTENAKAFEAYDFSKGFESEAAKKQKDAATFTEVALGFNVTPDSTKMYDKHHALLSKKFETLFSDENMTAMAATPEGRAMFSRAVEQLNQEAKGYESIYSSTFGDPSTADGKGSTYSDHVYRRDKGGGDDVFFQREGFKIDKTSEYFEDRLRDLDNSADILEANITFDPKTGTWGGYEPEDELLSMRQDVALRHFSYTADQATFTPPSNAVAAAGVYDLMEKMADDEGRKDYARTQIQTSPLDAVAYWKQIKGSDEDKEKSVQDLYKEMIRLKTFDQAIDLFAQAMVEEVKARKKREEDEAKGKKDKKNIRDADDGGSRFKPIPSAIVNGVAQLNRLNAVTLDSQEKLYPRGIKLSGQDLVLIYEDSNKEVKELIIDKNWEKDWLEVTFGPGAAAKIKTKLGATTTTTPKGDKEEAGGNSRNPN